VTVRPSRQLLTVPLVEWSEDEFKAWVVDKAKRAGWRVTVFNKAIVNGRWITPTSTVWVDVVLIRPPRMVLLEVKREKAWRWKPGQEELMVDLQACDGIEAYKVHPSEARSLLRVLARERGVPPGAVTLRPNPPAEENPHE
jgi:hypothetical protein